MTWEGSGGGAGGKTSARRGKSWRTRGLEAQGRTGHLLSLQGRCPAPTSVAVSGQPEEACEEGRGAAGQTGHGGHRVPAAESRKPCKSHSPVHAGPRRPGQRNREAMRLPHTSLLRSRRGHAVTTPWGPRVQILAGEQTPPWGAQARKADQGTREQWISSLSQGGAGGGPMSWETVFSSNSALLSTGLDNSNKPGSGAPG